MAEHMQDPMPAGQRPLWAEFWRYYNTIVAGLALLLMVLNALVGASVLSPGVQRWVSVGIAGLAALLVWLRERARQLGVVAVKPPTNH